MNIKKERAGGYRSAQYPKENQALFSFFFGISMGQF